MEPPRIALLQNQVTVDGRSRVLGEMARVINDIGVEPDLHTLARDADVEQWRTLQNPADPLRCRLVRPLTVPFLRGYVYQTYLHNWLSRHALGGYDVLINGNDCVAFLPAGPRRIHYVHFPLGQVFVQSQRYQRPGWKLFGLPLRIATSRLEDGMLPDDVVLTNSAFSAHWVRRQWPAVCPEVLPPPVHMPESSGHAGPRDIDVVTLGAIVPDKDQLAQVRIAARLPERRFVIIGYVGSPRYHKQVAAKIRKLGLTNVRVITDASEETVHDHLARARVFLHTKRDEHFGIGIAEAVGRGCVPVIHDSGGQTEIVTNPRLRFRDDDEAVRVIRGVLEEPGFPLSEREALRAHVHGFRPEAFRARFAAVLRTALASHGHAP